MNPEIVPAHIFGEKAVAARKKRAYVTFLAGCGDYVKGVVGLTKGMRKVKSAYPLVVAVLPDVPEDHRLQLRRQGCIVRQIQPIDPPDNQVQFAMPYYVLNYSKLRIWEVFSSLSFFITLYTWNRSVHIVTKNLVLGVGQFEEYSKMVYLDADIQVFENIDDLFDMRDGYFYAVMDCFCEKTWSHTPQYKIGYCQQWPDKVSWPIELGQRPSPYFNAGMFVFEPSHLTFNCLLETLMEAVPTPFAEQVWFCYRF